MTRSRYFEIAGVFGLSLARLLSLGLSVMGFFILGVGEACCSPNGLEGWAYLLFAVSLTLSVVVIIIYSVWKPRKPLLVWIWTAAIVIALEVMNFQTYGSVKTTLHKTGSGLFGDLLIPELWVPILIAVLCQFEAYGARREVNPSIYSEGL